MTGKVLRSRRRPRNLAELGLPEPDSTGRVVAARRIGREIGVRGPVGKGQAPVGHTSAAPVRILGLDPGSLCTGYAVIDVSGGRIAYVVSGSIRTEGKALTGRLQEIFTAVATVTTEFRPHEVAVEGVFMHRNADSALKLGQARGAALSATFAAGPRVFEYAPRAVKQAVVGTGAAQKEQVQLMVRRLLNLTEPLAADAADALAIALCHAHSRRLHALMAVAGSRP